MKYTKLDEFMKTISAVDFSRKNRIGHEDTGNMRRCELLKSRRTPAFILKIGRTRWGKIKARLDKKRAEKPNIWASLFK